MSTIEILGCIVIAGGYYVLEHPQDPGTEPFPSIWILCVVMALENLAAARGTDDFLTRKKEFWDALRKARDPTTPDVELTGEPGRVQQELRAHFDQCREGLHARKATTFSSNIPGLQAKFNGR